MDPTDSALPCTLLFLIRRFATVVVPFDLFRDPQVTETRIVYSVLE
jgi:hypothetical protein